MKQIFSKTLYILALGALLAPFAHAETVKTTVKAKTDAKVEVTAPADTKDQATDDDSLKDRRDKVATEFSSISDKLSLVVNRTAIAIDRLTSKNIDTTKATAQLKAAQTSLDAAGVSLDAFLKITLSDDKDAKVSAQTTVDLKTYSKKTEDNLSFARASILQSLAYLKATISAN